MNQNQEDPQIMEIGHPQNAEGVSQLPPYVVTDFRKVLKYHSKSLYMKLTKKDNMKKMKDYAMISEDQYGPKKKEELVRQIGIHVKESKDPIEEQVPVPPFNDDADIDKWDF